MRFTGHSSLFGGGYIKGRQTSTDPGTHPTHQPTEKWAVCRFVLPGMKMYEQDCFYTRLARKEFVSRLQITRPNGSSAHSQRLNVKYDVASRETNARVKRAQLQREVKSKRLSSCWTRSEEQQLKERSCFVDFKVLEKQKKTDESSYNDGQSHLKDPIWRHY